jgi:hypothetical protein
MKIPGASETTPCCAEVRWFVEVGGMNEGKTVIPVIKGMRGRV